MAEYQLTPALFTKFQDSPYTGSPSKQTDKAWHDLMESMVIRVAAIAERRVYGVAWGLSRIALHSRFLSVEFQMNNV